MAAEWFTLNSRLRLAEPVAVAWTYGPVVRVRRTRPASTPTPVSLQRLRGNSSRPRTARPVRRVTHGHPMLSRRRRTWALLWPLAVVGVLLLSLSQGSFRARAEDPAGQEWTYRKLARPAVPPVRHQAWLANPIDAFVLARLEKEGLEPNPAADRWTLLRRVTYDLTGLMPTAAERDAFLKDTSPDAYEKVVERLLGSPHYGERWAQHWLDVVRYSETEGFKLDFYRPDAWRYRDYVIRAFNADLPYN